MEEPTRCQLAAGFFVLWIAVVAVMALFLSIAPVIGMLSWGLYGWMIDGYAIIMALFLAEVARHVK